MTLLYQSDELHSIPKNKIYHHGDAVRNQIQAGHNYHLLPVQHMAGIGAPLSSSCRNKGNQHPVAETLNVCCQIQISPSSQVNSQPCQTEDTRLCSEIHTHTL